MPIRSAAGSSQPSGSMSAAYHPPTTSAPFGLVDSRSFLPSRSCSANLGEIGSSSWLRSGEPMMVRSLDLYNPLVSDWERAGISAECSEGWRALTGAAHRAAAAFDVPTASVAEAFMGPELDQDPRSTGWLDVDDVNTNDAGKAVIVELLHDLGYEPLVGG